MNFFPQIYDDELLYSVLARYRRMSGIISKRALIEDVFNGNNFLTSTILPQHLSALVANLPPFSEITVKEIIDKHTLFPYYTAFLDEKTTEEIFSMMVCTAEKGIELILGFAGSEVKPFRHLRYCPLCFNDTLTKFGESYWRRLFQVPGVFYCPEHLVLLKDSSVNSTDDNWDLKCADESTCSIDLLPDVNTQQVKDLNMQYISNVNRLMNAKYPKKNLAQLIDIYLELYRKNRYTSKNRNVYLKILSADFVHYYSNEYLKMMNSIVEKNKASNWLMRFLVKNGKRRHPLRHLLMIQFLNVSLNHFFEADSIVTENSKIITRTPKYDLEKQKELWLKIIQENPGANRTQLKIISKGLHAWIRFYDLAWYEQVTPKLDNKMPRRSSINWKQRDVESLELTKKAVDSIFNRDGKPVRVTLASIRREIGVRRWFGNPKLARTNEFIKLVTENINDYRIRKIKWALKELRLKGKTVTAYKLQLYAGFGGNKNEASELIEEILSQEREILL